MKILKVHWVTSTSTIGIIETINDDGEKKIYAGVGDGYDEKADIAKIKDWGGKIYPQVVKSMYEHFFGKVEEE